MNQQDAEPANPLYLAIDRERVGEVVALLDAGAGVHYERAGGYTPLIDAIGAFCDSPDLLTIVQRLVARGARLDNVTPYGESALSVASRVGRFDAVRAVLEAGADDAPLGWTPLMRAIALGGISEVRAFLDARADLSARDGWHRTPWLLSLHVGDVVKAQLLLARGADRSDRGRCGKTALMFPISNRHHDMLRWLLAEGFDPNEVDDFQQTALLEAAEQGDTEGARLLIVAGADVFHRDHADQAAIDAAANLDVVRLLVANGVDINEVSDEIRAEMTRLSIDKRVEASREQYLVRRTREFGGSNPQRMDVPFWNAMIASGAVAQDARIQFDDTEAADNPVWCFRRFGKSITELPDGRIIEIAGEHEDFYDRDFCIYNDVVVHHGDGTFGIYGYPSADFPPTDFHTATLVGEWIYIIGNLGYAESRQFGETPVYRLHITTFIIQRLATSGAKPGWISGHKAKLIDSAEIQVWGGKLSRLDEGREAYIDNTNRYTLDLNRLVWRRVLE